MKILSILILLFLNLLLTICQNQPGLKIAVKQDVILNFERELLPQIIKRLGQLDIPDQHFVEAKVKIDITNNHIKLNDLSPDSIHVTFLEPNKINIKTENISGSGALDIRFKLLILHESDHINIRFSSIKIDAMVNLITTESATEKGKLVPSGELVSLDINLDFDFDIHGHLIAKIVTIVKKIIFNHIKDHAIRVIKEKLSLR